MIELLNEIVKELFNEFGLHGWCKHWIERMSFDDQIVIKHKSIFDIHMDIIDLLLAEKVAFVGLLEFYEPSIQVVHLFIKE